MAARGSRSLCGFLCRASPPSVMPEPLPQEPEYPHLVTSPGREKERGSPCHPEQRPSPGCSARAGTAGALAGTPGALTDVRVAEGVLGVAGRACARLGAPVPQTPAAQEHDEPEPGSHCRCRCRCWPLQSCLARRRRGRRSLSSPALPCGATLASGAPPSECPAGRDGVRRGCLGAGARLGGWAISPGEAAGAGAGAGGAGGGEAVRASAHCLLYAVARRPSDIARVPRAPPLGRARPAVSDQWQSRITSSALQKRGGAGGAGRRGGAARTVQILIGNNAAVGTRVGGLDAPPRRTGRGALRAAPPCPSRLHPSHTPTPPSGRL